MREDLTQPDYVVLGDLGDDWTYAKLNQVLRYLLNGARLIALGMSRYWRADDGPRLDVGPIASAFSYATGQPPIVLGKPAADFFLLATRDLHVDPAQCTMVGDDIVTDIGGAQAAGMQTILVRTGKFRPQDLDGAVQAGCDHRFDCRSTCVKRKAQTRCPLRFTHYVLRCRIAPDVRSIRRTQSTQPANTELSERELEILKLLATGLSNKEIAAQLFLSLNTVKVHLRNIFAKLGVQSRTEATLIAIQRGYVSVPGTAVPANGEAGESTSEQPSERVRSSRRRTAVSPRLSCLRSRSSRRCPSGGGWL